jgi:hypothetical protein
MGGAGEISHCLVDTATMQCAIALDRATIKYLALGCASTLYATWHCRMPGTNQLWA